MPGPRIAPGPDPTFDRTRALNPKQTAAARKVGGTVDNFARELSNAVAAGEISPQAAEQKLKRATGVLPER